MTDQELPADLAVRPFEVTVGGYGSHTYIARSRGRALADAWQSSIFEGWTFGQFLKHARARRAVPDGRFGEAITVAGQPGYYVGQDMQYVRFVRPGSDVVLLSHPADVERPDSPVFRTMPVQAAAATAANPLPSQRN